MKTSNLLIVADSERDANMLYAVGMFVPDPFIFLRLRGRRLVVMSDLEIDRARRQARACQVLSLTKIQRELEKQGVKRPGHAEVIEWLLRRRKVRAVGVPHNFPVELADQLRARGIRVRPIRGGVFPEREQKTAAEVGHIRAALAMAEAGLAEGLRVIRASRVGRNRVLFYRNAPLTSERLRGIIETVILQGGGHALHTIVAGGRQACDPHEPGHGPLRAQELIILDVFPRAQKTGYFGDITRTVVRGRASEAARALYDAVLQAQRLAFQALRPGVRTAEVHQKVTDYFRSRGYETGRKNGRMQGFFHGTGHGLGLEIHEPPRISATSTEQLKPGHVVTVEPGLYYPEIGGVRLEDVAWVTDRSAHNLTRMEKRLEL